MVDATCPKVKAAQLAIEKAWRGGRGGLLLFGEPRHPEVRGLLSYAGASVVFSELEELKKNPPARERDYFLAAQTTQDKHIFDEVLCWLRAYLERDLPVLRTICDATAKRQDDVEELAGRTRSMVIVGGGNSGNTRRLAALATGLGVFTVQCENAGELPLDKLKQLQPVGLSAGASTPDAHIAQVEKVLLEA
jgi:4-hydroxy-3-methylbut-2-enyl diphosphate reductase